MFEVKVVGQYIARSEVLEGEKIKKNYEIIGNIPTLKAALSIVKNKLLGPALSAKYPDYVTFLTYHIVETKPLDAKAEQEMTQSEVQYMNRPALINHIKALALPVDARYYPNLFKLREAVQHAKDDPAGYEKHFKLREPDLRLDLEMAACNPQLFEQPPELAGFVASVSPKPLARPKASPPKKLEKKTGDRLAGLTADMTREGELGPLDEEPAGLDVGDL